MRILILPAIIFLLNSQSFAQPGFKLRPYITNGDTIMIEEPVLEPTSRFIYIDRMPEPGYDMYDFIKKNQKYPKNAYKAGIEGRINVQFVVTERGYFDSVKVLKPLHPSLDSEAARIINALPQPWKPGEMGGKIVRVRYTIPIIFRAE